MSDDDAHEIATEITQQLTDEGKLVEGGWLGFRRLVMARDAPQVQVDETRLAFFAGADHVFSSIMAFLEPGGDEPTAADLSRMDKLHAELEQFREQLRARARPRPSPPPTPTVQRLGDAPIEQNYRHMMNAIASALDESFNGDAKGNDRKVGFVLLVFEFGENEGRCNYISNGADRRDIVTLFKEQIKRFEGQPEQEGHG